MKKFLAVLAVIFMGSCSLAYRFPAPVTEDVIKDNYQVVYSPAAGAWSNGGMVDDRIVFTKHISSGSGSYSEYVSPQKTLYLGTTYEFLYRGRLIGYNQHDLKFYEVKYVNGDFAVEEMSPEQVAELFPGLDIIRTSSARDDVIEVKKFPLIDKTVLLLNDTPVSYYRYSFEGIKNQNMPFKSALKLTKYQKIIFSHYGENTEVNPALTIDVKYGF